MIMAFVTLFDLFYAIDVQYLEDIISMSMRSLIYSMPLW